MKCFKVVHKVLEKLYEKIPGDEKTRDAAITTALAGLAKTYTSLRSGGGPDFTDPVNRFAYLYAYMPVRAHWVYDLLTSFSDAAAVFDAGEVRIACIGGGPGSDLVGILKFLHGRGKHAPAVFCEIVDGCEQWKGTWADIQSTLDQPIQLNTEYVIHRVGESSVWTNPTNFANADIFTMSFFVSEIANMGDPAWDYVKKVLEEAKPGAVLLFNDNNHTSFFDKFDEIAAQVGWEVLVTGNGKKQVNDLGEQTADLGPFNREKFGRTPQLTGDVAWRVLRKSCREDGQDEKSRLTASNMGLILL